MVVVERLVTVEVCVVPGAVDTLVVVTVVVVVPAGTGAAAAVLSVLETTSPVVGSRISAPDLAGWLKLNMFVATPAKLSAELVETLPRFQLSSMNLRLTVWSVRVL